VTETRLTDLETQLTNLNDYVRREIATLHQLIGQKTGVLAAQSQSPDAADFAALKGTVALLERELTALRSAVDANKKGIGAATARDLALDEEVAHLKEDFKRVGADTEGLKSQLSD
jgi:hypothetical protein